MALWITCDRKCTNLATKANYTIKIDYDSNNSIFYLYWAFCAIWHTFSRLLHCIAVYSYVCVSTRDNNSANYVFRTSFALFINWKIIKMDLSMFFVFSLFDSLKRPSFLMPHTHHWRVWSNAQCVCVPSAVNSKLIACTLNGWIRRRNGIYSSLKSKTDRLFLHH